MIEVIIRKCDNVTKIISLIRKFDSSLAIGEIKKRIKNKEVLLTHDISEDGDICDELNELDKNKIFLELVENIQQNGADIEFYENGCLISYEIVCNLNMLNGESIYPRSIDYEKFVAIVTEVNDAKAFLHCLLIREAAGGAMTYKYSTMAWLMKME